MKFQAAIYLNVRMHLYLCGTAVWAMAACQTNNIKLITSKSGQCQYLMSYHTGAF